MNKKEINEFLKSFEGSCDRTIVIIDYGNVEKWKNSLNWKIDIKKLSQLVKYFSSGHKFLRRFYYGSDYGNKRKSIKLVEWSRMVLERAEYNNLTIVTKPVKYIKSKDNKRGFEKKCDLDVEMATDLFKERDNYDKIVLFSGDGDLMCAIRYLHDHHEKSCVVFGARDHIGAEVFDAERDGVVEKICYIQDFEYRLNGKRFGKRFWR